MELTPNPTFHIGLTMAGAGSAGCYTGGAMDYLFEILDLWEKAKNKNLPGYEQWYEAVPQHNVMIDAMGGASAGGMTTIMSAIYGLDGRINPVTDPSLIGGKKDNIFYDSWVNLDDDPDGKGAKTLAKAFKNDDLNDNKFVSLLNSKIIDDIADKALTVEGNLIEQVDKLPTYFSKDMDLLLSHTMLRGIPLSINFSTDSDIAKGVQGIEYNTFEHFIVSQYKLNNGVKPNANFLWLNPYEKPFCDIMSLTTKATGAFPVGLKFREVDQTIFTDDYIKAVTERIIYNRFGQVENITPPNWDNFPSPFDFVTVDGGAINNEPFGEVMGILKHRYNECYENGYPKYGVVMIDPFPDTVNKDDIYKSPSDLFSVVPSIINTLYEQSKVKKADLVEASLNPYYRSEIYPTKSISETEVEAHPIACGTVSAFGGFLDIEFRHHDFFLGRDNSRNFFRYYFAFEYKKDSANPSANIIHPIHQSWTDEMVEAFKQTGPDGKTYLPIIPDMNLLKERKTGTEKNRWDYSVKTRPMYDPTALFDQRKAMEDRFEKILDIIKATLVSKNASTKNTETGKWMDKYYHSTWFDKVKGYLFNRALTGGFNASKPGLARNVAEMAVKYVLTDLDKKGFLKRVEDV
jgi:hypothetical protein